MTYPHDSGARDGTASLLPVVEPDFPTLLLGEKPSIILDGGTEGGTCHGDPGERCGRPGGTSEHDGGHYGVRRRRTPLWRRGWFLASCGLGVGFCAGAGTMRVADMLWTAESDTPLSLTTFGRPGPSEAVSGGAGNGAPAGAVGEGKVPGVGSTGGDTTGSNTVGGGATGGGATGRITTGGGPAGREAAGKGGATGGNAAKSNAATSSRAAGRIAGTGVFLVGNEVAPGTYRASGGASCYWARLRATDGTMESIITNGAPPAQVMVTIQASDKAFETARCGGWEKVG